MNYETYLVCLKYLAHDFSIYLLTVLIGCHTCWYGITDRSSCHSRCPPAFYTRSPVSLSWPMILNCISPHSCDSLHHHRLPVGTGRQRNLLALICTKSQILKMFPFYNLNNQLLQPAEPPPDAWGLLMSTSRKPPQSASDAASLPNDINNASALSPRLNRWVARLFS